MKLVGHQKAKHPELHEQAVEQLEPYSSIL
jgi:hypothetical protein